MEVCVYLTTRGWSEGRHDGGSGEPRGAVWGFESSTGLVLYTAFVGASAGRGSLRGPKGKRVVWASQSYRHRRAAASQNFKI